MDRPRSKKAAYRLVAQIMEVNVGDLGPLAHPAPLQENGIARHREDPNWVETARSA